MPLLRASEYLPSQHYATVERDAVDTPDTLATWASAFRAENSLSSYLAEQDEEFEPLEDYDPLDDMSGYRDYVSSLVHMRSPEEMAQAKANIDRERVDRKAIADAGMTGTLAGAVASLSDPLFLPLLLAPPLRVGAGMTRMARATAYGAGAASETLLQESALHTTQITRTAEETLYATGAAFLLGGALGGILPGQKAVADDMTPPTQTAYAKDATDYMDGTIESPGLSAQRAMEREQISLADEVRGETFGLKDPRLTAALTWLSPVGRTANAKAPTAADTSAALFENNFQFVGRTRDIASEGAVETLIKTDVNASHWANSQVVNDDYVKYREAGGKWDTDEYLEQVGLAMFRGTHEVPQVMNSVRRYRDILDGDDFGAQALVRTGLLDQETLAAGVKLDNDWFHRMYNRERLLEAPDEFVDFLTEKILQQQAERNAADLSRRVAQTARAESVLEAVQRKADDAIAEAAEDVELHKAAVKEARKLPKGRNAALIAASKKLARAESRLAKAKRASKSKVVRATKIRDERLARQQAPADQLSRVDAQDVARDTHRRLVFGDPNELEWEGIVGKAGPLQQRTLMIPSLELAERGFLVTNAADVLDNYTRKVSPQVHIAERFGDPSMNNVLSRVAEEYSELAENAKTVKQKRALAREAEEMRLDLTAGRDVLMGRFAVPRDPDSFWVQTGRNWRALEVVNSLGGVVLASIIDVAIPLAKHGLVPYARGITKTVTDMKLSVEMAQRAGGAMDNVLHSRVHDLVNPGEYVATRHQKVRERAMGQFSRWSGLGWWTTRAKALVGNLAQDKMLRDSVKWADGKLSSKGQKELLDMGVDEGMAKALAQQPIDRGGSWTVDTRTWTDKALVKRYHANMLRHMDTNVLVPGAGDVPLWARSEFGRLIAQFKNFAFAAHNRLLIPALQTRDLRTYTAIVGTLVLATMSNTIKEIAAGKTDPDEWEINKDPTAAAMNALSYSGFIGLLMEPWSMMHYNKHQPHIGVAGPALGGGLRDTWRTAQIPYRVATEGEPTQGQISAARRLLPYQNLFYMRWAIDGVEDAISEASGAE